jgi:hypothetical protein
MVTDEQREAHQRFNDLCHRIWWKIVIIVIVLSMIWRAYFQE